MVAEMAVEVNSYLQLYWGSEYQVGLDLLRRGDEGVLWVATADKPELLFSSAKEQASFGRELGPR
jgi:hypothetical protein